MNNLGDPDLIRKELELSQRCDEMIADLMRLGEASAHAEYNYSLQKTRTALELKANGESATMIMQILKGIPKVAELMLARDIAKARYEAAKETINILKWQIKITENQIQREWGRNE